MKSLKGLIAAAGLSAVLLLGVACANGQAAPEPQLGTASPISNQPAAAPSLAVDVPISPSIGAPVPPPVGVRTVEARQVGAPAPVGISGTPSYPVFQSTNGQSGIWVTGQGEIAVEPDLVLLSIGVDSTGSTVKEANAKASTAMDAIIRALHDAGVEDRDIQTTSFNIFPQYEYSEELEAGIRRSKQILVGYRVNNSASIKIRDMDSVGQIIDDVVTAGGDSTRVNNIRFTLDDPKPLMTQLREQAVADALAKAQQFADLTGVGLGRLVFVSEGGATSPIVRNFGDQRMAFAEAALSVPAPSISGGELDLTLNVQAVFAIQ